MHPHIKTKRQGRVKIILILLVLSALTLVLLGLLLSFVLDFTARIYFQRHLAPHLINSHPLALKDRAPVTWRTVAFTPSLWEHARSCLYSPHTQSHLTFFSSCFICRYPTNKWVKLGTFHARDERIVQSFPLDEQLYAKYVKVLLFFFFFFLPPAVIVHTRVREEEQWIYSFTVVCYCSELINTHMGWSSGDPLMTSW